jgi:uncharacterized protein (TIGR03067 family)
MLRCLFLLLLVPGPPDRQPEAADVDRARLQGTWRVVAVEGDATPGGEAVTSVTFREDRIALMVTGRRGPQQARCRIDPLKNPKWIDFEIQIFDTRIWVKGIYALDRDALRLCFGDEKKRPTSFDASVPGRVVLKLERVKK